MQTDKMILEIIRKIVNDDKRINNLNFDESVNLIKEMELDSIEIMQFIVDIEEQFGVKITDEDNFMDIIKDLRSIREWIEKKAGNN